MKTFKDLEFKSRATFFSGEELYAVMNFDNGYGISVLQSKYAYCDKKKNTYEVAILRGDRICYDTPITDDVLGYQTKEQVTEVMKRIQELVL